MKRVTGIGGIFFKAKDAPALQAWYKRHLAIDVQEWGGHLSVNETRQRSLGDHGAGLPSRSRPRLGLLAQLCHKASVGRRSSAVATGRKSGCGSSPRANHHHDATLSGSLGSGDPAVCTR